MSESMRLDWQPAGTAPTVPDVLFTVLGVPGEWRWKPYAATGRYGRRGIAGRWQVHLSRHGGRWQNSDVPMFPWRENDLLHAILKSRLDARVRETMKGASLSERWELCCLSGGEL